MNNSNKFISPVDKFVSDMVGEQIQALIDKTFELRKSWEQRRLEAEKQVKSLDAKLAAYQIALKDYWEDIDSGSKK
jgi:hypothetical protein